MQDNRVNAENLLSSFGQFKGPAPVHLWNPPYCGEIDIRIARDGRWYHNGDLIRRPALMQLFASVLRLLVRAAGLSHLHLTPHSFRIGAATTAAHCGIPDSAIKALGRWQSVSYQTYTKYSPEALRQIALQLSSSSLSPSSPFGHILPADAARLSFDTVGVAFSASQQRR